MKAHQDQKVVGVLAHIYLVNQLRTKDTGLSGQISPTFVKAENDHSDEDKDEDGENIEVEASGGNIGFWILLKEVVDSAQLQRRRKKGSPRRRKEGAVAAKRRRRLQESWCRICSRMVSILKEKLSNIERRTATGQPVKRNGI